jgi:uncharacterized integral membrane protein
MATLIITLLFGLVIAFFATQNTQDLSLNFLNYTTPGVPAYVVIVGAVLLGLGFSWILNLINSIFNGLEMRGKENKIKDYKQENAELLKRIHQLELENAKNTVADDKSL